MDHISAQEWGRRQADLAPEWSEEKWRRIALILGLRFVPEEPGSRHDAPSDDIGRAA